MTELAPSPCPQCGELRPTDLQHRCAPRDDVDAVEVVDGIVETVLDVTCETHGVEGGALDWIVEAVGALVD